MADTWSLSVETTIEGEPFVRCKAGPDEIALAIPMVPPLVERLVRDGRTTEARSFLDAYFVALTRRYDVGNHVLGPG